MTDKNTLVDYNIKDIDAPSSYVLDNHKVGQLGTIPLDLCIDCVKKFDVNTPGKKQKIVTNEEGKDKEAIEK